MGFNDIFKKAFMEGFSGGAGFKDIVVCLMINSLLALYIFFIYRLMTKKTFYSKSMNISMAALSVITASVILAVQSNVILSLGMVGALSIVRFRTAIKDPMDLVFLFWSISTGIICGAGLAEIAVLTSLILTAGIFILNKLPIGKTPKMVLVRGIGLETEDIVIDVLKKYCKYFTVKSRNYSSENVELIIEVRLKQEKECIQEISSIKGVENASLLCHDGEVSL